MLWSVLEALRVLHGNSMLHRDVSPDNIFLQNVGPPVLLDLGAARRAILDSSHKHTAILKVNYAPIEQYADAPDLREGPWTDLYALAAMVHGCVCNESPLPATFRVVRDRMPTFAQVAQTALTHFGQLYTPAFVAAIAHGLAIEPDQRPQSVDAFAQEMGLQPPPDMARFDWREALGPRVTLDTDVPAVDTPTTALLTTQPAPLPRTQTLDTQPTRQERREAKAGGQPAPQAQVCWAHPPPGACHSRLGGVGHLFCGGGSAVGECLHGVAQTPCGVGAGRSRTRRQCACRSTGRAPCVRCDGPCAIGASPAQASRRCETPASGGQAFGVGRQAGPHRR